MRQMNEEAIKEQKSSLYTNADVALMCWLVQLTTSKITHPKIEPVTSCHIFMFAEITSYQFAVWQLDQKSVELIKVNKKQEWDRGHTWLDT